MTRPDFFWGQWLSVELEQYKFPPWDTRKALNLQYFLWVFTSDTPFWQEVLQLIKPSIFAWLNPTAWHHCPPIDFGENASLKQCEMLHCIHELCNCYKQYIKVLFSNFKAGVHTVFIFLDNSRLLMERETNPDKDRVLVLRARQQSINLITEFPLK